MTYTRPWDPATVLLGGRDADEIDDAVREFATDVSERLASIVVDVNADPVVLKVPGINGDGTVAIELSPFQAYQVGNLLPPAAYDGYVQPIAINDVGDVLWGLPMPQGARLISVSIQAFRSESTSALDLEVRKIDTSDGSATVVGSAASASIVGDQAVATTGLDEVCTAQMHFVAHVTLQAGTTDPNNLRLRAVKYVYKVS